MRIAFDTFSAEPRNDQGKGASRKMSVIPARFPPFYGAHAEPVRLSLEHHKLLPLVADENSTRRSSASTSASATRSSSRTCRCTRHATPSCILTCSACSRTRRSTCCQSTSRVKRRRREPGRRRLAPHGRHGSHLPAEGPADRARSVGDEAQRQPVPDRRQGACGRDHLALAHSTIRVGARSMRDVAEPEPTPKPPSHPPRAWLRRGAAAPATRCQEGRRQEGRGQGREEGRRQVAAQAVRATLQHSLSGTP